MKVLVTGAGGFIGGHLVNRLVSDGFEVKAADSKRITDWHQINPGASSTVGDLSIMSTMLSAVSGQDYVYNLAADMGGMGFISSHKADCMLSVLISTHALVAARNLGARRVFYSSSACVYAADKQAGTENVALKEEDAYPAMPEDGYGWEKLFSERMHRHFWEDYRFPTRVARLHNCYGPYGAYEGGREKAPAAICRKVAEAVISGEHKIDIWGDGEQVRSFMYIDDCVEGIRRIMDSNITEPVNLGSSESVTINQLVSIVEDIAGVKLERNYIPTAPMGVRGRSSDNTKIKALLNWEPSISLKTGLEKTYAWVFDQVSKR